MLEIDWAALWSVASDRFSTVLEFLLSPVMQRLYVLAVGFLTLVASTWWAFQQLDLLRGVEFGDFEKAFPGKPPQRAKAIAKRNAEITAYRAEKWRSLLLSFATLFFCGFIIPAALFYIASNHYAWLTGSHYSWFDSEGTPFLRHEKEIARPSSVELALFILGQILKGSLTDFLEVFKIEIGEVTNNPANVVFSFCVFVFRSLMGVFMTVSLVFVWRALRINRMLRKEGQASPAT